MYGLGSKHKKAPTRIPETTDNGFVLSALAEAQNIFLHDNRGYVW